MPRVATVRPPRTSARPSWARLAARPRDILARAQKLPTIAPERARGVAGRDRTAPRRGRGGDRRRAPAGTQRGAGAGRRPRPPGGRQGRRRDDDGPARAPSRGGVPRRDRRLPTVWPGSQLMPVRGGARRYAEAAFQIADRDGALERGSRTLRRPRPPSASRSVARLLANPAIPYRDRAQIVDQVLGQRVSGEGAQPGPAARPARPLRAAAEGRDRVSPALRPQEGIVEATVTSASPLDHGELAAIRRRIGELTSGKVEMTTRSTRRSSAG